MDLELFYYKWSLNKSLRVGLKGIFRDECKSNFQTRKKERGVNLNLACFDDLARPRYLYNYKEKMETEYGLNSKFTPVRLGNPLAKISPIYPIDPMREIVGPSLLLLPGPYILYPN